MSHLSGMRVMVRLLGHQQRLHLLPSLAIPRFTFRRLSSDFASSMCDK
jgi:hypothetical protein